MKNLMILKIKGKNVKSFINKLSKNKINLYNIEYLNKDEINITIDVNDCQLLKQNKSTYEITIINYKGFNKIKNKIEKNFILITFILIGLALIITLSNIIFKVEVIYDEENIRTLLINELRLYDIDKYKFVKSFKEVEQIKKEIMNKYKDKIEWLEINRIGTKYEVRLELRKIKNENIENQEYEIVAKKDAVIKKIEASAGEKKKNINEYVKKGDTIIGSKITLNDNIKGNVSAKGNVYGEVWYQVEASYPFVYKEEKLTGKSKILYGIKFLGKTFNLFDFKPYKNAKTKEKKLIYNQLIPLSLVKINIEEVNLVDEINTIEEATNKAIILARRRIEEDLTDKEYVISSKLLKREIKDSKIECVVFFTVYEDITEYKIVEELE